MKLLIVILTSFMFFGCIEEGTIVYDQDYPEAPENIGGSGSGNDRVPGDGAGSAGGTSDGSGDGSTGGGSTDGDGSTGGTSTGDGTGSDGGDTSSGSDGGTSTGDGAGSAGGTSDGSGDGSTGGTSTGDGTGSDGGDTSSGSSDGSGSTGDGTGDGSGSGDTGGDTGSSLTGGDTSTGSDGGETGSGSSDSSGSTGGSTDGGSGDGGTDDGSGSDGSGSTGSTGDGSGTGTGDGSATGTDGTDGGTTDGSGSGSTGGSTDGSSTDGAGSTGGGSTGGSTSGSGSGSGSGGSTGGDTGGSGTEPETDLTGITPTIKAFVDGDNIATTYGKVDGADNYTVYYSTTSPAYPSGNTEVRTNLRYTVFAPAGGERYYFQVVANAPGGNSEVSAEVSAMIKVTEPPTSPVDNMSTSVTAEAAAYTNTVSWDVLEGAEGYTLYHSTNNPAFPSGAPVYVDNSTTSFVHTGLDADTTYYYQVLATHTLGDSNVSNVASAAPYADLTGTSITTLNAEAVGNDIVVNWNAVADAESYRLYYSTVAPAYPGGAAVEIYNNTFTLFKPEVETVYYFQVRAIAKGGNSNISNMDNAIINIDCPDCGNAEVGAPIIDVTAKVNKNNITWDKVTGAVSYKLYWNTQSFPQGDTTNVEVVDNNTIFTHNALDSNTFYFYRVSAVDTNGDEYFSNLVYSRPHGTECNAITPAADNDPDLLAYYAFEGNLNDTQGDYHLTTLGGEIGGYVDNCLTGTGGYFDGKGGYGYNLDFKDTKVTGLMDNQWSISVWANADEDMNKFSSIVSTTAKNMEAGIEDGWDNGFQIDVNGDRELRWFFSKTGNDPNQLNSRVAITLGEWYHIAVTYDNGVGRLYVNGVERKNATGLDLGFNRLKVGINRWGQENWKGFIDDLKVFGRTLTPVEVVEEFEDTLPAKVENVAAINLGDNIGITWDAVEGVGTYRVYYSTSGNPTVADNFFQVQNATSAIYPGELAPGVTYYFRVAAVNNIGAGELSDATNESSTTIAENGMLLANELANEPAFETTIDNTINSTAYKAEAIEFSPDGSKMYLIVATWTGVGSFVQYDLATPWDPRTATRTERFQFCNASLNFGNTCFTNNFKFIANGTRLIGLNDASNNIQSSIRVWDLSVAYDISTLNSEVVFTLETYDSPRVTHPFAFEFNPEGTRMWVGGYNRMGNIGISQEWELAGPYDFSTMTKLASTDGRYFRQNTSADTHQEVIWKADGTKFIMLQDEGSVRTFNVSVPFELSSSVYGTESALTLDKEVIKFPYQSVRAIHFSPAQDRLYYVKDEADGTVTIGSMPFSW